MEFNEYLKVLRERVLSDCPPDKSFWTCHGRVIRNIHELADSIEGMNDYVFKYHVNEDNSKNDFAQWVFDVLQDGELAHRLKKVKDRLEYVKVIKNRINELESAE